MSATKKQKIEIGLQANFNDTLNVVSTTSSWSMLQLNSWLLSNKVIGLGLVDFRYSNASCGSSLGCFAREKIVEGDTIFIIPQACIIGINNAVNSKLSNFIRDNVVKHNLPYSVTSELLIWLYMIEQRAQTDGDFDVYLNSLDVHSPSLLAWNTQLLTSLDGTNLGTSLHDALISVRKHVALLEAIRLAEPVASLALIPQQLFNLESLIWARGHYLARRYPGSFAFPPPAAAPKSPKSPIHSPVDAREVGLENLGALVPLLDILNHNDEQDWLRFEVCNRCLYVKCNFTIEKGEELYSNYGLLSNEKLMYAYGFAVENNIYDSISVSLKAAAPAPVQSPTSSSSSSSSGRRSPSTTVVNLGVFHIEAGGVNGIPPELWSMLSTLGQGDLSVHQQKEQPAAVPTKSKMVSNGSSTSTSALSIVSLNSDCDAKVVKAAVEVDAEEEEGTGEDGDGDHEDTSSEASMSEDEDEGEGGEAEGEGGIEVGVEECCILKDYLSAKKAQFAKIMQRSKEILRSFGVALSTTPRPEESDEDGETIRDIPQSIPFAVNIRARYIQWYLEGQYNILCETITAMDEMIVASTQDYDDEEGEEGNGEGERSH